MSDVKLGRCDGCLNWHYHYPDDLGVCTAPGGPGNGQGFGVPCERAVISSEMRAAYGGRGMTATSCDTQCDKWEQRA